MKNQILIGDALEVLKTLPDNTINTCVTSPPYFGLRDYGVEGQIGLEESPEQFIENLVHVFSEVRRTLRDDGTLWVNIGDSYYNYRPGKGQSLVKQTVSNTNQDLPTVCARRANKLEGLKEKDLIGIPWMLAFALRADGWYLRQDIIWNKPNPMPESVKDRCTKSHEYIFLLSKSPKYYFDGDSIKEKAMHPNAKAQWSCESRSSRGHMLKGKPVGNEANGAIYTGSEFRNRRSVWSITTKPFKGAHFATFPEKLVEPCILAGCPEGGLVLDPFFGAGTTGLVAKKLRRDYVGIELNPDYAKIAEDRIKEFTFNILDVL
jgi:DNA modification methylase